MAGQPEQTSDPSPQNFCPKQSRQIELVFTKKTGKVTVCYVIVYLCCNNNNKNCSGLADVAQHCGIDM